MPFLNCSHSVCLMQSMSQYIMLATCFLGTVLKEQRLCTAEDSGAAAKRICRVQGIAVCWSPEAVYYIPLNPAAPGVHKLVGSMLGSSRAKKVTYDLKAQMLALLTGEQQPNNCAGLALLHLRCLKQQAQMNT